MDWNSLLSSQRPHEQPRYHDANPAEAVAWVFLGSKFRISFLDLESWILDLKF
jgi:hypothetical protein